ncbi:MAG: AAA domain-containing protein [bacterium]
MLQEATKILGSAFKDSFIKRLSLYLHDCVREEVKSSTFRNLNQDKDNKWFFVRGREILLSNPGNSLSIEGSNTKITELMIQAEIFQKDRYLIYGHLFLTGKSSKKKKEEYLTPLLYLPCKLERIGKNIICSMTDETLSLNTGALAGLIKYDDEDEVEHVFEGLIDVVPELPLTSEKIQIFLTTLKSIIPDIEIEYSFLEDYKENEKIASDKLLVTDSSAVILTKRPSITAGVLHELTQIAEKPSGVFRETALNVIQEEFVKNIKNKNFLEKNKDFTPIAPLDVSDSQRQVMKAARQYPVVAVYGPPGTGKSQTIVNLVSHLVASGKTVLVASRMDKAVDVISERLNNLGAPFLCLRAGRANYQKQLNFKLQDLLANKIDLDSDFESSVLADVEDMKILIKDKIELKNKCKKIIELEENWFEILQKHEELSKNLENLVQNELSKAEIQSYRALLDKIELTLNKTGLINSFISKFLFNFLNKKLKLSSPELSDEFLNKIRLNLLEKEQVQDLKIIESSIGKTGNLHQILNDLKELRKKQKILAGDILKNQRIESLKALIRDQSKRQRLIIHSKTLIERKKSLQNRILEQEDFKPLLEAFPCWAVTTYAISESIPLKPGLFDVAIIDEASQCDIASCFPVLFRAKSAVIVGDDKQLPHLSFLEKAKEQSFLSQYNIPDRYQIMWRFRTNSIFDIANFYSTNPILLDEHFRSFSPIIKFSNQEFYGSKIRIMNKELDTSGCIELNIVKDAKVDLDNTRNMAETEKILEKLQDIIINCEKNNEIFSIGIISPFRGQVELVKKAVSQVLSQETIKKYQIEIGTAHTFQGDEKDIIILSFTLAPNSHFQSLIFIQKPNLFNVAITRARKKLICFISRDIETLPSGLLKNYLEYIQDINKPKSLLLQEKYNNSMQEDIAELCREEGLTVIPNIESAGFNIDLVVCQDKNSLAIECDGYKNNKNSPNYSKIWKQSILERCGWKVMRITAREWHYSKKACINRITSNLRD